MILRLLPVIIILLAGVSFSLFSKKLTINAAIGGALIGLLLFWATGYMGLVMMAVFFTAGTMSTSFKTSYKNQLNLAEENQGRRNIWQVLANAGVAAILAVMLLINERNTTLYLVMIAGSFASAIADTLSSEMGNIYGKRFYNIKTLKKDTRGLNGVISAEGTLIGIAGSCLIAFCYWVFNGSSNNLLLIIIAGTAGNLLDSFLGATLERKQVLNNNGVNFFNTAFGALVAGLLLVVL